VEIGQWRGAGSRAGGRRQLLAEVAELAEPVVAGPADWEESPSGDTTRLREHIDHAAAELATATSSDRR
jgi:hypothetical protein